MIKSEKKFNISRFFVYMSDYRNVLYSIWKVQKLFFNLYTMKTFAQKKWIETQFTNGFLLHIVLQKWETDKNNQYKWSFSWEGIIQKNDFFSIHLIVYDIIFII